MADLIEELVEAGVHFGHQSRKWNPKMKPFLLQKRSGVHIINVEETVLRLEEASEFLSKLALDGGAGAEAWPHFFVQDAVIANLGGALWSGSLWKFAGIYKAGVGLVSKRNGNWVGDA